MLNTQFNKPLGGGVANFRRVELDLSSVTHQRENRMERGAGAVRSKWGCCPPVILVAAALLAELTAELAPAKADLEPGET